MGRSTGWLGRTVAVVWLALVVVCLVTGWIDAAIALILLPVAVSLLALVGIAIYWRRNPHHARIGDWFHEDHHIGHW